MLLNKIWSRFVDKYNCVWRNADWPASWNISTKSYQWQWTCGCSLTSCPGHQLVWMQFNVMLRTKMIQGMKGMPYESRLEELGLLTLEEKRNRSDLIEVNKMTTGLSRLWQETFFKLNNLGITRRHSLKLMKQRSTSEIRQDNETTTVDGCRQGLSISTSPLT